MRVLITGGAGFIGSNLVRYLVAKDTYELVVLDNLSVGQKSADLPPSVRFVKGDFTDRGTLEQALESVDVVVHLAAMSGVMDSINDPRACFDINVAGSFDLLQAARESGVRRVIAASTGGAILGDVPPPISENMAASPLSPYGASKLAMEGYMSAFAGSFGLSCAALRFSNIYGPGSGHKNSVVAAFIKNVLRNEPLTIYGDGTQQRDYLFVGDLVKGIEGAIQSDVTGVFQLGTGRPTSLLQVIEALQTIIGRRLDVRFEEARRGEVHATWCDISRASCAFGFDPETDVEGGLRKTWEWFAAHPEAARREQAVFSSD